MTVPVFAESPEPSQNTTVQFTVADTGDSTQPGWTTTDWVWTVPATQTFIDNALLQQDSVEIKPAVDGKVLVLADGATINVRLNSSNEFKMQSVSAGNKSVIPYQVKIEEDVLSQNANVLNFTAGVSSNKGESQQLTFVTDKDKIKLATVTGAHTDTITFSVDVQAPRVIAATFSDGTELT